MRKLKVFLMLLLVSIFSLFLTGCDLFAQSPMTPTVDGGLTQTQNALRTDSASTVEAAMTEAAIPATETVGIISSTNTPEVTTTATDSPTVTSTTIIMQTQTPSEIPTLAATFTQTSTLVPNWASRTPKPPPLLCSLIRVLPPYNTVMKPGEDFDARWTIQNNGSDSWTNENVEAVFRNGAKLQKNTDVFTLSSEVETGDLLEIIIDMQAPNFAASYAGIWMLTYDDVPFCYFSVNIVVKE